MGKYFISAGHNDKDPGACANGHTEAAIALEMRDMVAAKLQQLSETCDVATDGRCGENQTLNEALKQIGGSVLAIELHCNASANPQATGVEVVALERDKRIAQRLARAIAQATGQRLRGDGGFIDQSKTARGRLAFVAAGGLIVEMVFISNPGDLENFLSKKDAVAQALAAAICGQEVAA
jgi:N-acetylmuramoyl-L-alanine amidase